MPPSSIDTFSTCSAACSISLRPDLGGAGERQLARARVLDQRPHRRARRGAGDHVFSTPAGRPGLLEDLGQREHRQRRELRRLHHHRAAGGDRRADLAGAHRHREVPGGDHQARADRLAHHQHAARRRCRPRGSRRRSAAPRPRTSGRTRRRRRSRPSTPRAACPSRASSAAPARRRARSASRRRARGSRRARWAAWRPTRRCALVRGGERAIASSRRAVGHLAERLAGGRVLDRRASCPRRRRATRRR